jgi:nucleoporin NDC1
VYIWSASPEATLGWVDEGGYGILLLKKWKTPLSELTLKRRFERPRLNERSIYLRIMFLILGLVQSVLHLLYDADRVPLQTASARPGTKRKANEAGYHPYNHLKAVLPAILQASITRVAFVSLIGTVVYTLFLRQLAWRWAVSLIGSIYTLSKSEKPTRWPGLADLISRFLVQGFSIAVLWESSNASFTAYLAEEPLKNGQPITNESKDPNGTLLLGLRAKKEVPRVRLAMHKFCSLKLTDHRLWHSGSSP